MLQDNTEMTGSFPFALFSIIDNFSQCLGQYEQKHYFRDFSPPIQNNHNDDNNKHWYGIYNGPDTFPGSLQLFDLILLIMLQSKQCYTYFLETKGRAYSLQ